MSHVHDIIDSDNLYVIDPITRTITGKSDKLVLSQGDHKSERLGFSIPRYIEDHDMSLCDRVKIDFTNITRNKKEQRDNVYVVDDLHCDRDTVFFSWLVSGNATQLVGSLKFTVTFLCYDDSGNVIYNWGTAIYDGIQIIERFDNTEVVFETYPDMIEQMKQEIVETIPPSSEKIDETTIAKMVEDYLSANPPTEGEADAIEF